jgi:hypothetical protein
VTQQLREHAAAQRRLRRAELSYCLCECAALDLARVRDRDHKLAVEDEARRHAAWMHRRHHGDRAAGQGPVDLGHGKRLPSVRYLRADLTGVDLELRRKR